MTVSILLTTLGKAEVQRREPNAADLVDPDTYVVDVGMEYVPERHNFDHHQDRSLPCAFHLVMKHLGYHEAALNVFGWYAHMSMMDVRGPYQTAEHLGVDTNILFAASSPIDGYILGRFSQIVSMTEADDLYGLMKEFGADLIRMIGEKTERLERLKQEAQIVPVGQLKAVVCEIEDNPKLSMELFLRYLGDEDIVMSITPSQRGTGWELLRLGDNMIVDFRAVAANPEIRFVHVNGFIAKTRTLLPLGKVADIAAQAILKPERAAHHG